MRNIIKIFAQKKHFSFPKVYSDIYIIYMSRLPEYRACAYHVPHYQPSDQPHHSLTNGIHQEEVSLKIS